MVVGSIAFVAVGGGVAAEKIHGGCLSLFCAIIFLWIVDCAWTVGVRSAES